MNFSKGIGGGLPILGYVCARPLRAHPARNYGREHEWILISILWNESRLEFDNMCCVFYTVGMQQRVHRQQKQPVCPSVLASSSMPTLLPQSLARTSTRSRPLLPTQGSRQHSSSTMSEDNSRIPIKRPSLPSFRTRPGFPSLVCPGIPGVYTIFSLVP